MKVCGDMICFQELYKDGGYLESNHMDIVAQAIFAELS